MSQEWLRRQAVQIAAQLPESPDEAIQVLELTIALVNGFLRPQEALARLPAEVVPFPSPASSSSR